MSTVTVDQKLLDALSVEVAGRLKAQTCDGTVYVNIDNAIRETLEARFKRGEINFAQRATLGRKLRQKFMPQAA